MLHFLEGVKAASFLYFINRIFMKSEFSPGLLSRYKNCAYLCPFSGGTALAFMQTTSDRSVSQLSSIISFLDWAAC